MLVPTIDWGDRSIAGVNSGSGPLEDWCPEAEHPTDPTGSLVPPHRCRQPAGLGVAELLGDEQLDLDIAERIHCPASFLPVGGSAGLMTELCAAARCRDADGRRHEGWTNVLTR